MKSRFQRRDSPEDVINTEMKKVIFTGNFGKSSNKNKGVPFVLAYHLLPKTIKYILRKHLHLLYINEEVKKVFQPGLMTSFALSMERKTRSCKC